MNDAKNQLTDQSHPTFVLQNKSLPFRSTAMKPNLAHYLPGIGAAVLMLGFSVVPGSSFAQGGSSASASTKTPPVDTKTHKLIEVKKLIPQDKDGGFIRPRFSPDGLQLMITKPGYQGIYLVPAKGGQPKLIAEANAYRAEWTEQGKISIPDRKTKKQRILNLDGSEARMAQAAEEEVFCKNDQVFAQVEGTQKPVAITDKSDRFIQPHLCPKHKMVGYVGVQSGLYLSKADGTGAPTFLGAGQDLTWAPNSSFILYAHTDDDGHEVVESDLYRYDLRAKKLYNLTAELDLVVSNPSIAPDAKTVAFDADGDIYVATIQ